MTYYVYDQEGYVGNLATITGMNDFFAETKDLLPTLFDDGKDDPETVIKALEGFKSDNPDVQDVADNLLELAKECAGILIISDGAGIVEDDEEEEE